jgi:DNA-directed RNA polymerase subunit RPC12/RpoP
MKVVKKIKVVVMSKWKCGICNTGFDNYQAQGFDGVIYCPLCYFKELYKREKQENQQLKKQKDDVVELIKKTPFLYSPFKQEVLRMLGEIDVED